MQSLVIERGFGSGRERPACGNPHHRRMRAASTRRGPAQLAGPAPVPAAAAAKGKTAALVQKRFEFWCPFWAPEDHEATAGAPRAGVATNKAWHIAGNKGTDALSGGATAAKGTSSAISGRPEWLRWPSGNAFALAIKNG